MKETKEENYFSMTTLAMPRHPKKQSTYFICVFKSLLDKVKLTVKFRMAKSVKITENEIAPFCLDKFQ